MKFNAKCLLVLCTLYDTSNVAILYCDCTPQNLFPNQRTKHLTHVKQKLFQMPTYCQVLGVSISGKYVISQWFVSETHPTVNCISGLVFLTSANQIRLFAGDLCGPQWWSLQCSPCPLVNLEGNTPSAFTPFGVSLCHCILLLCTVQAQSLSKR